MAAALVRAGATMAKPVASAPLATNDPQLKGGTLYVFSVRSTDSSTRLEWAITHPTLNGAPVLMQVSQSRPWLPHLIAKSKDYAPTEFRYQDGGFTGWLPEVSKLLGVNPEPRPIFGAYAPLPADVTEVDVTTPLIATPIKVKVDRGAEPVPAGTPDVPILGRSVIGDIANVDHKDPLIITLHGLRRAHGGTVLYYSAVFPAGAQPQDFANWGAGGGLLNGVWISDDPFVQAFGLIDRGTMKAYVAVGQRKQSCYSDYTFRPPTAEAAMVCWVLFPPLDTTTNQVDVMVGGKALIQSVPVTDGALLPAAAVPVPDLGRGWPTIPDTALTWLQQPYLANATTLIRDVVTDGAMTQSGQQLEPPRHVRRLAGLGFLHRSA